MKKYIYIMAAILVVAILTIIVIFKNKAVTPQESPSSPTAGQVPSLPSASELKNQGKAIVPSDGENVIINDPYKDALKIVSENADMKKTPDYEIVYLGSSKSFVITLSGNNLADSRNRAEQSFLDSLGISKTEACKLIVSMGVAPEVNRAAAGKNYGLSFCPNGKTLPTN